MNVANNIELDMNVANNNTQNVNASDQTTQQQVVSKPVQDQSYRVYDPPKKSRRGVLFLVSCGSLSLLFLCLCAFSLYVFSSPSIDVLSPTSDSEITLDRDIQINEKVVSILGNPSGFHTKKIAVIDVNGEINYSLSNESLPTGASNRTIAAQLRKADNDEAVKVIILRFNTPGGVVAAAEPICNQIKEIDKRKPVIAFIDTEGASLGYLLANCAREIYSRPEAITGSIGVRADLLDITGILTNLGAKRVTITNTAGSSKTQEGLFDKNSAEYKQFQAILDEIYEYFVKTVWDGRKGRNDVITEAKLRSYADGRIFSGKQAKDLGLVDSLGQYNEVINSVYEENWLLFEDSKVKVVEYSIERSIFAELFGTTSKFINVLNLKNIETRKVELVMVADY